ncbi:unnamed protein product [Rotaria socialis]|uniref:LicD/FKTN/FKRP nucleotidyltransferase domain-containing protein n=2 Tax=Rotaria socialis TaxID=392032 RepID=A0A817WCL1_9BILA|nr:unnamed protein product [Rotaria socialis]
MIRFIRTIQSNQALIIIIITLFVLSPFLNIFYQPYSVSSEIVPLSPSNYTRYDRFCHEVAQRIKSEIPSNNIIHLDPNMGPIPYYYSQWRSNALMPRGLTQCEHAVYMHLLFVLIEKVFKKYNIKYMMMAATLLGSYTHHDILPWDDDVDLRVSISDRYRLQSIIIEELSSEPYSIRIMQLHNSRNYDKIFFSWCPHAGRTPWRFPFIDIFYHDQNSTHVWLLGQPSSCPVRVADIFPLVLRPLGSLWLYGPREPMAHFESRRMQAIETGCFIFPYSHKYEKLMMPNVIYANCTQLKTDYPLLDSITSSNTSYSLALSYIATNCLATNRPYDELSTRRIDLIPTFPIHVYTLFEIQDTLNILCYQDQNTLTTNVYLDNPTQIILFIIIDQSPSQLSSIDIDINFNQSSDSPSIINKIRLGLFVTQSNFTINNQTKRYYTSNDIAIFLWEDLTGNNYDPIDLIQIQNSQSDIDRSLCKWDSNRWNRLFNENVPTDISYFYFLKTTTHQFIFTLVDTSNKSLSLLPPSPYLSILYCYSHRFDGIEIIIIVCFGTLFAVIIASFGLLHYFKRENNRTERFPRYHNREVHNKLIENQSKNIRHRASGSRSSRDQENSTST